METIWIKSIEVDRNHVTYRVVVSKGLIQYFNSKCEMFVEFRLIFKKRKEYAFGITTAKTFSQLSKES